MNFAILSFFFHTFLNAMMPLTNGMANKMRDLNNQINQ